VIRSSSIISKKEKKILLRSYCRRFGLNNYQTGLIDSLFQFFPFFNIKTLFHNEEYYLEVVSQYLQKINNKKSDSGKLKVMENDFNLIKTKIDFIENVPLLSNDIPVNQNVKLRLEHVGFISGSIVSNDKNGMLINTSFKSAAKKLNKNDSIVFYYWDDFYQYEAHSRIKKIAEIHFIKYLLINHCKMIIKNKNLKGLQVNREFPVYFTHIFKLPEDLQLKSHTFQGNINSISIIGVEIFTRFKVNPEGIFLFEFQSPDKKKRFHFTGKITDYKKLKNGKLLFINYIDMKEDCKEYVHQLIFNELKDMQ
jgi:hypothetical protein